MAHAALDSFLPFFAYLFIYQFFIIEERDRQSVSCAVFIHFLSLVSTVVIIRHMDELYIIAQWEQSLINKPKYFKTWVYFGHKLDNCFDLFSFIRILFPVCRPFHVPIIVNLSIFCWSCCISINIFYMLVRMAIIKFRTTWKYVEHQKIKLHILSPYKNFVSRFHYQI